MLPWILTALLAAALAVQLLKSYLTWKSLDEIEVQKPADGPPRSTDIPRIGPGLLHENLAVFHILPRGNHLRFCQTGVEVYSQKQQDIG